MDHQHVFSDSTIIPVPLLCLPGGGTNLWSTSSHKAAGGGQRHRKIPEKLWSGMYRGPSCWDGNAFSTDLTPIQPHTFSNTKRDALSVTYIQVRTLISPFCWRLAHTGNHTRQGQKSLPDIKYGHRHRGEFMTVTEMSWFAVKGSSIFDVKIFWNPWTVADSTMIFRTLSKFCLMFIPH